jgi:hypothetical protein
MAVAGLELANAEGTSKVTAARGSKRKAYKRGMGIPWFASNSAVRDE